MWPDGVLAGPLHRGSTQPAELRAADPCITYGLMTMTLMLHKLPLLLVAHCSRGSEGGIHYKSMHARLLADPWDGMQGSTHSTRAWGRDLRVTAQS